MLTVILGFDGSGKTSSSSPLESLYSVMPSTEVTLVTPLGSADCAKPVTPISRIAINRRTRDFITIAPVVGRIECQEDWERPRRTLPAASKLKIMLGTACPLVTGGTRMSSY